MIAAAALLTAVVYVFTPLTAAGQEGSPTGFFTNTRYLMPGLRPGAGAAADRRAPCARRSAAPGMTLRLPDRDLRDHGAEHAAAGTRATWSARSSSPWRWSGRPACSSTCAPRGGSARVAIGAVIGAVLLAGIVLGRAQEVQYFKDHYTNPKLFLQDGGPQKAYDFARRQRDRRIGISGSGEIFFGQYGYLRRRPLQPRPVHRQSGARTASTGWRRAAGPSAAGSTPATTTSW